MFQIIIVALLLCFLQFGLYKRKAHKLFFYILPTISIIYAIYIIFKTVREQALINTSFPLWAKIMLYLLPIMLSLIFMILFLVLKYKKLEDKGLLRFIVLRQFLAFLGIMLLILSCTIYLAQEYVIFFPNHNDEDTSLLRNNEKYERVNIHDEYYGWLKDDPQSDTLIIYFGGNAQNTSHTFLSFEELGIFQEMKGFSFLSVDYPSYGDSIGSLSQGALFTMADEVFAYAHQKFPNKKIDLIGYSIGTGIACYSASTQPLHKFVLVAPYNNGRDLFNNYFPIFHGPLTYLIRYPLTSDQYVKKITCDTLLLMSKEDSIVPMSLTQKLEQAFTIEPQCIVYEEKAHGDLVTELEPWQDIMTFLNS